MIFVMLTKTILKVGNFRQRNQNYD